MFARIRSRFDDMRTLRDLCERADGLATKMHDGLPGAEHFVLAALELPDGTARWAFTSLGADPDAFAHAIIGQYREALSAIGVDPAQLRTPKTSTAGGFLSSEVPGMGYKVAPSARNLLTVMAEQQGRQSLVGAHVLVALAKLHAGVAHRALRTLQLDAESLAAAASVLLEE